MVEKFDSWIVHSFFEFSETEILDTEFKLRSSIYGVSFLIIYKEMSYSY
jgi:hypothetical protein